MRCPFCDKRIVIHKGKWKKYLHDFMLSETCCKKCHDAKKMTWFDKKIRFKILDWRVKRNG